MTNKWNFDEDVASRFHSEALSHIPSYDIVIDKSLQIANLFCDKSDLIIDVGSAVGYTVKRFIEDGFFNTYGVENSQHMIEKSYYKEKIILNDKLPNKIFKLILINWTLHFIPDKLEYLRNMIKQLSNDGYFILTDKLIQSDLVKKLYYNFKIKNNVKLDYILEKEQKLKGIMFCHNFKDYQNMFYRLNLTYEIIHADLGFVTFLCKK